MSFLTTDGLYVYPALYERLFLGALELVRAKLSHVPLHVIDQTGEPIGDGRLETDYKSVLIGTRGGIQFTAHLAIDSREFKVDFIVDECFLGNRTANTWGTSRPSKAWLN